jgi:tetratricopeptide (TPR) repeat protein
MLPHLDRAEEYLQISMSPLRRNRFLAVALSFLLLLAKNAWGQAQPAPQPAVPDTAEAHLGKGYDALKQDRYEVAVAEFRAALALDPALVLRAQFPLAVALFEQHKSAEARREFEAVRRETGDHPNILYYLGRLDIEDRNFSSAVKNLSQAMAKPPFSDTAYYLGFAYFKEGDLANAEKWLKEAAQSNPRDSRIPYQLGFVYRKEGREDEAKKSLALSEDLHRQDDTEAQLRAECGEKLDKGPRDEAHALCEKLYHADDAERLTALGMIYGQHGDLEAALKPLLRAAELSPQSPQVQYNLALTYFQLNRFEDARAPLAQALKRWPDLFPLNALYGAVLVKLGEYDPAYEVLRHARQLNLQDSATADLLYTTTLKLAEKSRAARQFSGALRYFEEAAKFRPQDPEPHRGMAEIYTQIGKPAQAEAERQEADRLSHK